MRRHPGRSTFLFLSGEVGDTLGASESSFLRSGVKRVQAIVKGGCQQCRGGRRSCSTNGLPSFDDLDAKYTMLADVEVLEHQDFSWR